MKRELIQRYVYAVLKYFPEKDRKDIQKNLEEVIEEKLKAACLEKEPESKDIEDVLLELGSPESMAEELNYQDHNYLIGPRYFNRYLFILKIVLGCVIFGILVASTIKAVMNQQVTWYMVFWQELGSAIAGLIMAFGFITLIFALMERLHGRKLFDREHLQNLQPIPNRRERIPKIPSIMGIAASLILIFILVAAPQTVRFDMGEGAKILLFHVENVKNMWFSLLLFVGIGIAKESIRLYDGRYSTRVVITTLAANTFLAVLVVRLLATDDIFNPRFLELWKVSAAKIGTFAVTMIENLNYILMVIFLAGFLLDFVTVSMKAWKLARSAKK